MTRYSFIFLLVLPFFTLAQQSPTTPGNTKFYGREHFLIEGTAIPESQKESPYDRLPASYKEKVRKPVWDLSKNSAGISVRFITNSSSVRVKWEVLNDTRMNHMAETGIKGVDLYCKVNGSWQYVNTGRPTGKQNEALLVSTLSPGEREFKLYLPLYDGTTRVEIGIDSTATVSRPPADAALPIVFYGTSITQGGCASRPGMAYTNIVSRRLNVDCINLGFSGNGRMEEPVGEVIANIKASFYVIDCLPNMTPQEIRQNTAPLARQIRGKNPGTPIVFVENIPYAKVPFEDGLNKLLREKNEALHAEYENLKASGMQGLIYITTENATGTDNEGSVDGVHLTDLGFQRFAEYLLDNFKKNDLQVARR